MKAIGVKSNRTGIGAKVRVLAKTQKGSADSLLQVDEVRSGVATIPRMTCGCTLDWTSESLLFQRAFGCKNRHAHNVGYESGCS